MQRGHVQNFRHYILSTRLCLLIIGIPFTSVSVEFTCTGVLFNIYLWIRDWIQGHSISISNMKFISCEYIKLDRGKITSKEKSARTSSIKRSQLWSIFLKPTTGLLLGQIYLKLYTPSQINAFKLEMCNDNVRVIADPCGKIIVWITLLSNVAKCDLIFTIALLL